MLGAAFAAAALAWTALPPATLEQTETAAARVGDSIYVVGGFVPGDVTTAAVGRYDIGRRRWSRVKRMPFALNHPTAVAYRGRLYVHGGYRSPDALAEPTGELLRYDPRSRRWRRLPASPTPRAAHAAAAMGGRLYVAGGSNDSGSLNSLEVYDFARRRWTLGPSFPGPARNHTTGVASRGRFYVLGGRDTTNLATAERYDPRRRRWEQLPPLGAPRGALASARLRDGRIVVFGGEDFGVPGASTIAPVELFDPRTRRWRRLPDMRTPRHGLGGAALGNRVFALAGGPSPGLTYSKAIEFLDVPRRRR
jgi:N-acetylneuraminic acid mutarotase